MLKRLFAFFVGPSIREKNYANSAASMRVMQSPIRYVAQSEAEPPDVPDMGVIHLVVDGRGRHWLAVLLCPCGCGTPIQLPMSAQALPSWRFHGTLQRPSLWPSVRRSSGCRSHFILKRGWVQWCCDP